MPTRLPIALALAAVALLAGCASTREAEPDAASFIAEMDALPPDERVPHWDVIRARMVRKGPEVGDMAPDFALSRRDGDGIVRLSEFPPTRPVVLVFGSWT